MRSQKWKEKDKESTKSIVGSSTPAASNVFFDDEFNSG